MIFLTLKEAFTVSFLKVEPFFSLSFRGRSWHWLLSYSGTAGEIWHQEKLDNFPACVKRFFLYTANILCWVPCYNLSLSWLLGGSISFHNLSFSGEGGNIVFSCFQVHCGHTWNLPQIPFRPLKQLAACEVLSRWKETKNDPVGFWFCIRRYHSKYPLFVQKYIHQTSAQGVKAK